MALIVAFEGLPGSGKTTAIGVITDDLRDRGFKVGIADIETVGHAPVLRPITRTYPLGHPARILLFWVLRLQQYEAMQKLADVDIVLVDRFWGSTIAYDIYGNGVPKELVGWLGQYLKYQPDITLFFEVALDVVQQRKRAKTMSDLAFAKRVEQGYQKLADELSWFHVDAAQKPELVKKCCLEIILSKLPRTY